MNVTLNKKAIVMDDGATLYDLLQRHFLPQAGIAVAINNHVVPKSQWESRQLEEGDNLTIIQAACGG